MTSLAACPAQLVRHMAKTSTQRGRTASVTDLIVSLNDVATESNQLLLTLHGLARLPGREWPPSAPQTSQGTRDQWAAQNPDVGGTLLADDGLKRRVATWYDRLDRAYLLCGAAESLVAVRAAMIDLASEIDRPAAMELPHLYERVRAWPHLFLRKFESKLLAFEQERALFVAISNVPSQQPLQRCWISAKDSYDRAVNAESGPQPKPLKKVYEWLDLYDNEPGYDLPDYATWAKYIRAFNGAVPTLASDSTAANTPRGGRQGGRSVQRRGDL